MIKNYELVCCWISVSKNSAANPDHCTATFDSNLVVARHSHRDFAKVIISLKENRFEFLKYIAKNGKFFFYLHLIIGIGCHSHHSLDCNIFEI